MSDPQPSGFKGFLWGLAGTTVGAAVLNIAAWLFPSVDDFFAKSGKLIAAIWAGLTFTEAVPIFPLCLGVVLALGTLIRQRFDLSLLRAELEGAERRLKNERLYAVDESKTVDQSPQRFDSAQQGILGQLFHAQDNMLDPSFLRSGEQLPQLVFEAAIESLISKKLIEQKWHPYAKIQVYALTDAGKSLMLEVWKQQSS